MKATAFEAGGFTWDVTLNLAAAKRIENTDFSSLTEHQISMFHPDMETIHELLLDTAVIAGVIWAVIRPEAEKRKVGHFSEELTEDQRADGWVGFDEVMTTPVIGKAKSAMWEAMADFFQLAGISMRPLVAIFQQMQREMDQTMERVTPEVMEGFATRISQELEKLEASQPA